VPMHKSPRGDRGWLFGFVGQTRQVALSIFRKIINYKIMKSAVSIIYLFLLTLMPSCFPCEEYVPQKFKFVNYYSKVVTSDEISLGDKIIVSANLPMYFYDSMPGKHIEIDKKIEINNKLNEYVNTGMPFYELV
jgi:hypothetical protein